MSKRSNEKSKGNKKDKSTKKKGKKISKETHKQSSRKKWEPHELKALLEILKANETICRNTSGNAEKLSAMLLEQYRLNIAKERIRAKLRGKECKLQLRQNREKKLEEEDSESESEASGNEDNDDDDDDDDNSGDDEEDIHISIEEEEAPETLKDINFHAKKEHEYHQNYPSFWKIDCGKEGTVHLLKRQLSIKAHHLPGHDDIHIFFKIPAPTKPELQLQINECPKVEGKNHLEVNLDDESISSQILQFEDICWSIKILSKPPEKPMDYTSGCSNKYTWIHIPKESQYGRDDNELGDVVPNYISKNPAHVIEIGKKLTVSSANAASSIDES